MAKAGGLFTLDGIDDLIRTLDDTNVNVGKAAQDGMKDIARSWKQEARDEAPIKTGSLRRDIAEKLNVGDGANVEIEMSSNTYNGGFNYAYFQHEVNGNDYLDRTAEANTDKWQRSLEKKIEESAKKAGW